MKIGIQDSLATAGGFLEEDVIRLMRNKKEYRKFEWSGISDGENKSRAKEEIYIFILWKFIMFNAGEIDVISYLLRAI